MKLLKQLVAGAAMAVAATTAAHASMINVGGVIFDPNDQLDFSGAAATITQSIAQDGTLSGFGVVTTLNGNGSAAFCPGCELTIQYGGFTPIGQVLVPTATPGLAINYAGGWMKLYVDTSLDANPNNPLQLNATNTGNGTLWASLVGHQINGSSLTGNVVGTAANPLLAGLGLLDIIGGLAFGNLDTNEQNDGADLAFTSSFSKFPAVGSPAVSSMAFATGTANFSGNSIPEPSSIALLGLGLLGAALSGRRKTRK